MPGVLENPYTNGNNLQMKPENHEKYATEDLRPILNIVDSSENNCVPRNRQSGHPVIYASGHQLILSPVGMMGGSIIGVKHDGYRTVVLQIDKHMRTENPSAHGNSQPLKP